MGIINSKNNSSSCEYEQVSTNDQTPTYYNFDPNFLGKALDIDFRESDVEFKNFKTLPVDPTRIKMLLFGSQKCGKTMFRHLLMNESYNQYEATIGVDFGMLSSLVVSSNKAYDVYLWDTSGNPKFAEITLSYIRGTNIMLIFYKASDNHDISDNRDIGEEELSIKQEFDKLQLFDKSATLFIVVRNKPESQFERLRNFSIETSEYLHFSLDVSSKDQVKKLYAMMIKICDMDDQALVKFWAAKFRSAGNTKKPAIYLYGPHNHTVDIKLVTTNKITYEHPKRYNDSWKCVLTPHATDGQVLIHYHIYPYIYWEGDLSFLKIKTALGKVGVMMFKKNNFDKLDTVLREYLSEREANEFREYWESVVLAQQKPYVKVIFVKQEDFEKEFGLEVSVKPNEKIPIEILRIECIFSFHDSLEIKTDKVPNDMYKKVDRSLDHVTIVEWGGILLSHNDSVVPYKIK